MSSFNTYLQTATSLCNKKKNIISKANAGNNLVENYGTADLKEIINNLNPKIDGYEQELIDTFRKISKENKRLVFTSLMEIMNSTLSSQD